MEGKPLSQSNPRLRNPRTRNSFLRKNVISSSAIEGIDTERLQKILPESANKKHS